MDGRYRVMHVIRPADGGMKEHLKSLINGLDSGQFDVSIVCPGNSKIALDLRAIGVKILPVEIVGELNPIKDFMAIRNLQDIISRERPDLIHTHGAKAGIIGRIAGLSAGSAKIVSTVHNFALENSMPYWKKELLIFLERKLAKFTDCFITVSEALRRHIVSSYGIELDKVTTIYNGVNLERFTSRISNFEISSELTAFKPKKNPIIGVIARLAPQKGVKYFIEAAKLIHQARPDAKFWIVGDGPEREFLESYSIQQGLKYNLYFLGQQKQILPILNQLDVFVLPSVSEGLSITAIEALAIGCPVVATKVGGVPEVVVDGYNGILADTENPIELAQGVLTLLNNRTLALLYSVNGRKVVEEKFNLSEMVTDTADLYLRILSSLPLTSNVI